MSGVVIGVGAAVGAVIGGGSSLYSASKTNRNQIKAFKKQMYYMQLNYNYNQAALNRQERSLYDSAVGNLFNMSVNAFQNQSQVEAAQAESGVEGRTQDKLGQVIRGTNLRQQTALKEAYEVDVWNVRSQKEALYIETKNAVEQARDNLSNSFIKGSNCMHSSSKVLLRVPLWVPLLQVLVVPLVVHLVVPLLQPRHLLLRVLLQASVVQGLLAPL